MPPQRSVTDLSTPEAISSVVLSTVTGPSSLARTAFAGDETVARLGIHRVGILVRRDERLGRRVRVLGTLLEGSPEGTPVRLWIEGLPGTDHLAGALLDELARG